MSRECDPPHGDDDPKGPSPKTDRHERAGRLLIRLRELDEAERERVLEEACAGDPALREEVMSLLAFADGPESAPVTGQVLAAVSGPARDLQLALQAEEETDLPERIGRYRILGLLGAGGMGTVYEAEQEQPRRRVALKVLRPMLGAREMVRRFEREAHVLGQLEHPGIAKVFEAGVAESEAGTVQPYFAMELIRGVPVTDFAETGDLDTRERLQLLARICDAVHHAHSRGFVHRDIKPANVLVDASGQPKVLDFGVARAARSDTEMVTRATEMGQVIGTLSYMSPEQASGNPELVDTRSDIYALGILSFELLASRLPHRLQELPLPAAVRVIQEQEVSRLGSISTRLRGDVETIVAKALEKDPARRYQSAAEMAEDIRRHLRHEPIVARPPSAFYQVSKFARRHKAIVAGIAVAFVTLLAATALLTRAWQREAGLRQVAIAKSEEAVQREQIALRQAYKASIAASVSALESHQLDQARARLQEAPESLRGWEWRYLQARLDDTLFTWRVGERRVHGLAFTAGGAELVVASRPMAGPFRLSYLHPRSGKLLRKVTLGTVSPVYLPRTDPPLWHVAAAALQGNGGEVRESDTGALLCKIPPNPIDPEKLGYRNSAGPFFLSGEGGGSEYPVRHCLSETAWHFPEDSPRFLAFHAESERILHARTDRPLARIRDTRTGRVLTDLRGHEDKVVDGDWAPDGERVYTASPDGTLRSWDARSGRLLEVTPRRVQPIASLAVDPRGGRIAEVLVLGTIRILQSETLEEQRVLFGTPGIQHVVWSPDGTMLYASAGDRLMGWDVSQRQDPKVLRGHQSYVYTVAVAPDDRTVVSGSWDGTLRWWDSVTGEAIGLRRLPSVDRVESTPNIFSVVFSPDGEFVVAGTQEGRLYVLDGRTGEIVTHRDPEAGAGLIWDLAFVADGDHLVLSQMGTGLVLVDARTWDVERSATDPALRSRVSGRIALSPDGERLLRACGSAGMLVVRLPSLEVERVVEPPSGASTMLPGVVDVAWSPDGTRTAMAMGGRTPAIHDATNGEPVVEGRIADGSPTTLLFSPDGNRLFMGSMDAGLTVYHSADLQDLVRLHSHTNYIYDLAATSDGRRIVTASGDYTLRIWDDRPLGPLLAARRESRALREALTPQVDGLYRELGDWRTVADALAGDESLEPAERAAALQVVLRRSLSRDDEIESGQ